MRRRNPYYQWGRSRASASLLKYMKLIKQNNWWDLIIELESGNTLIQAFDRLELEELKMLIEDVLEEDLKS